jgi:hypothetical protein
MTCFEGAIIMITVRVVIVGALLALGGASWAEPGAGEPGAQSVREEREFDRLTGGDYFLGVASGAYAMAVRLPSGRFARVSCRPGMRARGGAVSGPPTGCPLTDSQR